jgi:hypothetical protein
MKLKPDKVEGKSSKTRELSDKTARNKQDLTQRNSSKAHG